MNAALEFKVNLRDRAIGAKVYGTKVVLWECKLFYSFINTSANLWDFAKITYEDDLSLESIQQNASQTTKLSKTLFSLVFLPSRSSNTTVAVKVSLLRHPLERYAFS